MKSYMNTPRRDVGLDVLKGLGCALMVLAHSSIVLKTDDVFSYIGGFAPIMFFTVSGVTATFQAAKYNFRSVFWPYLFLLVLGYSYNALGYTNFLLDPDYQILQVIAFSAVVVYLAERYFHPAPWVYFILAVLTFLVKAFVAWYPPTQNVPVLSGTILPMGYFPIIPWLALFFLGVFAYRIPNSNNLWLALTLIFVYVALDLIGVNLDPLNKWSLSLGYFLICCISTLLAFFAVRGFAWFQSEHGKGWILFFGRNSLLFLYVHLGLINTAYYFKWFSKVKWLPHAPYVLWIGVTVATILLMWMLLPISGIERIARFFRWLPVWIFLSVMVFLVPMLIHKIEIVFAIELSIGILLSLYYHALAGIFRPRFAGFFKFGSR